MLASGVQRSDCVLLHSARMLNPVSDIRPFYMLLNCLPKHQSFCLGAWSRIQSLWHRSALFLLGLRQSGLITLGMVLEETL